MNVKKNSRLFLFLELLLVSIITIPAFVSLVNGSYFPMHDDQHIVRLFLLDQGIRQGSVLPRWVDGLGFGFGYPLFNFYPPLIYYVAELFHLIGFSLITSIKIMITIGFLSASLGIYWLAKNIMGKAAAFISTVLYTYFFYHAVTVYVRGALAEFFTFAILPFVFLFLYRIYKNPTLQNAIGLGISFALLILTHPLIAFPAMIYIGFFIVFFVILNLLQDPIGRSRNKFGTTCLGIVIGLGLSAFFWFPSMVERKFTMVDSILLKDLASYKLHYVFPQQLWYSPWGYGGSVEGLGDGLTFQLGKIHIFLLVVSIVLSFVYLYYLRFINKQKRDGERMMLFYFFLFLVVFSLFMTTSFAASIWDRVRFLWYLQFPWRFLTFATVFIALCGGFSIYFLSHIEKRLNKESILIVLSIGLACIVVFKYQQYFKPQQYLETSDAQRTTEEEIKWRISKTSFEFVPKGVKTKKSEIGTTIFDIDKKGLPDGPFRENPLFDIHIEKNEFKKKWFVIEAAENGIFQLNTFNFPGWHAYLNGKPVAIHDNNPYKLIMIDIPKGKNSLRFYFDNTPVRKIGNSISILSGLIILGYFLKVTAHKHE